MSKALKEKTPLFGHMCSQGIRDLFIKTKKALIIQVDIMEVYTELVM
jgi:hypothetical protein